MNKNEKEIITGLEESTDFKNDEYNLVASLLKAAKYKTDDITEISVKDDTGAVLFRIRVHPLSQEEIQAASNRATSQIPNPNGSRYPKISGKRDNSKYHSYLVYAATIDEDKKKIWGNPEVKDALAQQGMPIIEDAEMVDVLLKAGDKSRVVDIILEKSGFGADTVTTDDDYIKN